ncbi:MAG: YicC family protein [Paludibacteraceae bacterium]|nr:YicC family protein [Paludibacteraceae bacterium]
MIQSMTGYGKATCEYQGRKIVIELKSLNSKGVDMNTRVASLYREKDVEIRNIVAQRLLRGKIDLFLYYDEMTSENAVELNVSLMNEYRQQLESASSQLGVAMPANLMEVLIKMPDVMKSGCSTLDPNEWDEVAKALDEAIIQIENFRKQEGAALQQMFEDKLSIIENLLAEVEPFESERIAKIRARLEENLNNIKDKIAIDPNRLEQEMIFYLEKLDINEEKVRLRNHIKYFRETMNSELAPGKKLGFIAQEMGREINTLGSKSNHSEMQIIVVKMKDQLEQIKEQVLNVL